MKKFFTLFALLSVALSASAEYVEPSATDPGNYIFYEDDGTGFTNLHMWNTDGDLTRWPGTSDGRELIGQTSNGNNIYKWSITGSPTGIKFTKNEGEGDGNYSGDQQFVNHGYYYNGGLNHTVDNGLTVYFYKSGTNWGDVFVYAWDNNGVQYRSNNWTINKMIKLSDNLYKYHFNTSSIKNVIFNNGYTFGTNQTADLDAQNGKVYVTNGTNDEGKYNTITFDASLTIADGQDFSCAKDYAVVSASYTRSLSDNWGTLCLPFAITKAPDGVTFYTLSSVDTERKVLSFTATNSVEAGMPVVFKASGNALEINEGVVPVSATAKTSSTVDGWELNGSFAKIENYTPSGGTMYFFSENKFWSGVPAYIPAYRAWFIANVYFGANPAPFRIEEADAEGLQFVEQEDGTVKAYYDLQGRKLNCARKGLVIENGKIIMVK